MILSVYFLVCEKMIEVVVFQGVFFGLYELMI